MCTMQCNILRLSKIYLLIFTLSSLTQRSSQEPNRLRDSERILKELLATYDPGLRPSGINETDGPLQVTVNTMILDFTSISDYDMEYGMQIYFRQEWIDQRLKFEDNGNIKYITLTDVCRIWTPDLFFVNEKDAQLHKVITPNRFLRIHPSGMVLYSSRLSLTVKCNMQLDNFPFDSHPCDLKIESYGYTANDIQLKWKEDNPVQITNEASLVGFTMSNLNTFESRITTNTGEFSSIGLSMVFNRQTKYYLLHTFLPSAVLVALTWGAFLLDRRLVMVRSIIVLCSLFGLSSIAAEVEATVPHVGYLKATDVWVAGCFVFLLATLVVFVLVSAKRESADKVGGAEGNTLTTVVDIKQLDSTKESPNEHHIYIHQQLLQRIAMDPDHIDSLASVVLPSVFLGFAALYFYEYWC